MGKDRTDEKKTEFHIVRSVKGGSGKTAYSIFKTLELAKEIGGPEARVLYLDADFRGTALKTVIYALDQASFSGIQTFKDTLRYPLNCGMNEGDFFFAYEKEYREGTLNDYLNGKADSIDEILVKCGIYNLKEGPETLSQLEARRQGFADFIFSSPDAEEKVRFQYMGENDNPPTLSIGKFKRRFEQLLLQVLEHNILSSNQKKGQYDYVVIDMPPGEDEYSRTLLRAIEKFSEEKQAVLYSYFVSTNDIGHYTAEFAEAAYQISKREKNFKGYEAYTVVFNALRENEFKNPDHYLNCLKDEIKKKHIMDVSKIYYSVSAFQPEYYEFCRSNEKPSFGYRGGDGRKKLYDNA